MYLIAAFKSQLAAHGGALEIAGAAAENGLTINGVALARIDTLRAIHVDPLPGFEMPGHVLQVLDDVVPEGAESATLRVGETALAVALTVAETHDTDRTAVECQAVLESRGAHWVICKA